MLWLGVAYLGALAALLITSLWSQNDFTGNIERTWTLDNFRDLFTIDVYRTITFRTISRTVTALPSCAGSNRSRTLTKPMTFSAAPSITG